MTQPSTDLIVSGGAYVAPTSTLDLNGSTTIIGPILTQTHFHWRNDDGTESGATSATLNAEDTALFECSKDETCAVTSTNFK